MSAYKESIEKTKEDLASIKEDFINNRTVSIDLETVSMEPVFIIQEMDTILDFINSCDEVTKSRVLKALKENSVDKALFMTAYGDDGYNYVILMNISEEASGKNLALVHSKSLKALGTFMEEFTDLSTNDVEQQFSKDGEEHNKSENP